MHTNWLLIVFTSLTTINTQEIPDVTLISEKIAGNNYRMTCVANGNALDSAIVWNEPLSLKMDRVVNSVSKYIPSRESIYNCDIDLDDFNNNCSDLWTTSHLWELQRSLDSTLGPVMDRRWEDFKIYYTNGSYNFYKVASIEQRDFKLHFSLRLKQEAHIYFCDGGDPLSANCYWIILGGWSGDMSIIRKCTEEKVPPKRKYPEQNCKISRDEVKHNLSDPILNEMEWRHFTVEKDVTNTISVWQMDGNTPLLHYTDTESIWISNVFIRSFNVPGYWKLHDYFYTFTTVETGTLLGPKMQLHDNFCLTMFVAMCNRCSLILDVISLSPYLRSITVIPKKGMVWQEVKIQFTAEDTMESVYFIVTTTCPNNDCDDPFWAIDNFQICSPKEVRVLSIEKEKNNASCQIIKYPHWHITQTEVQSGSVPEMDCSAGTFDKSCIDCSTIFGSTKPNCNHSIICEPQYAQQSVCKCVAGYIGTNCERVQEKLKKLRITNTNSTNLTISWDPPDVRNGKFSYYSIQYKQIKFLACGLKKITKPYIQYIREKNTSTIIKNLHPYSEYSILVTTVTNMAYIYFEIDATTLATDVPEESEIPVISKLEPNSMSVKITLELPNCTLIKGPVVYYITANCYNSWCLQTPITQIITPVQDFNPIILSGLHPYTNYTVEIKVGRNTGRVNYRSGITKTFTTKASVPGNVRNLTAYSKNGNSIYLRFLPPNLRTGIVDLYYVSCCNGTTCTTLLLFPRNVPYFGFSECKVWPNFYCITFTELEKGAIYNITVRAVKVGTGYGNTSRIEVQTIEEAPSVITNLTASWDQYHNLTISWNHPDIENGPLKNFEIKIKSEQTECYNKNISINETNYKPTYYSTIPFEKCYSAKLNIFVVAVNRYVGKPAMEIIPSPPPTPSLSTQLSVIAVANTNITLNIPAPKDLSINSYLYIIVSNSDWEPTNNGEISEIWKNLELPINSSSWIAAEIELDNLNAIKQMLVVGNGKKIKSKRLDKELHNHILHPDTNYKIIAMIISEYEGFQRYSLYVTKTNTYQESYQFSYYILFALLLLPLVVAILLIFFKCKKKQRQEQICSLSMGNMRSNLVANAYETYEDPECEQNGDDYIEVILEYSKSVKVADFEKYVKGAIKNGELERQHKLVPRGQTKPWDYGLLEQNMTKNRHNKIIAYDHTRVKLTKLHNDPYSDYINANYIEGYNTEKAYIATHSPKSGTVNDFWRMIWQNHVYYIVMLQNIMKEGMSKTEKYWPNVNESLQFGKIKVKYASLRVFADYELRTFLVSCDCVTRRVTQLHFTTWPDYDIPLYPQSLVPFLQEMSKIPRGISPIVVHCCTGVGRTGAIILCDLCLRMAEKEGVIDALKHLRNLREQRVNLLDSIDHYKLVHLMLLEYLLAPETSISCDADMEAAILRLLKSKRVVEQMQYLQETAWKDQAIKPRLNYVYNSKCSTRNRFQNIIPCGYGRVQLSNTDEVSGYINAVEVDGYRTPKRFIVTQQPLMNTVSDFWIMIDKKEATAIISLNKINLKNETSCAFWPTPKVSEIQPTPFISLQFLDQEDTNHYSVLTIRMLKKRTQENTKRIVKLIAFKGWPANKPFPDDEKSLLKLWEATEKVSRGNNPIVVTCYDGARACGLFVSLSFVVERMKLEHDCDVCLAVRTIRHNRKEFVTEIEQFSFLYRAVINYINEFSTYSTFIKAKK